MRKTFSVFMVLLLILVVVPNLSARPLEHRISKRISELQHGIDSGVQTGAITPDESKKLQSRLDKIQKNFDKARGKRHGMSDDEVASVNNKLDALSKNIKREKRDYQTISTSNPNSAQVNFEPTRMGSAKTEKSGMFAQPGMTDISDNPGFFTTQNRTPGGGVPQDLDKLIRPVLKRLFKDAKLVEDIGKQPPRIDGEVEENKLVYVVRLLLTETEADQLHAELNKKEKWPASPRLGSKPVHGRKEAGMSLFKSTSLRGYSLVISVNYETQRIVVISYRLGSKYDRLM